MSNDYEHSDELRLCPTCRMKVSVWATKCHHCGEELGRPRREETKLTLKDLGGGEQTTYAPSGNVTGALESFRVEEVAAEVSRSKAKPQGFWAGLIGKKQPLAEPQLSLGEELPELDEYSKNLAASILDDMPSRKSSTASQGRSALPTPPPVALMALKVVGVLVAIPVIYLLGSFLWTATSNYLEARNRPPEINYINKAPEMLARGAHPVDAFEEAAKAAGIKDNEENQMILDDVRALLLKEVDSLMARNPWSVNNHTTAYKYIQRAVNVDNHPATRAKFDEVNQEVAAYKFVLKSVDEAANKATFRLNRPNYEQEATVEVAERLMDRFIIQKVTSRGVEMTDDKVEGRKLSIGVNEGVKSRY